MDGKPTTTVILKRDALGRVTLTQEKREALLDEFERSGMKGQPFARMAGVNYQTFASWIQKRRRARGDYTGSTATPVARKQAPAALRLVEAVIPAVQCLPAAAVHSDTHALELLLPGGARLLLHDARQAELAAHLLRHLNAHISPLC